MLSHFPQLKLIGEYHHEAQSFPKALISENCSLLETDDV